MTAWIMLWRIVNCPTSTHTPLATATATIVVPSPIPSATLTPSPSATTFVAQASRTTIPATRAPTRTATPKSLPIAAIAPIVWDPRLDKLGVQLIAASVNPGESYWRIVKAEFWDEKERQGKHHIFVNVLDEQGARLYGQSVIIEWPDDRVVLVTENKPEPEYSANFPLDALRVTIHLGARWVHSPHRSKDYQAIRSRGWDCRRKTDLWFTC